MRTFATHLRNKSTGEMAEWSIAAVLKTVELRGSGGSNPSLSAQSPVNRKIYGTFFIVTFEYQSNNFDYIEVRLLCSYKRH